MKVDVKDRAVIKAISLEVNIVLEGEMEIAIVKQECQALIRELTRNMPLGKKDSELPPLYTILKIIHEEIEKAYGKS